MATGRVRTMLVVLVQPGLQDVAALLLAAVAAGVGPPVGHGAVEPSSASCHMQERRACGWNALRSPPLGVGDEHYSVDRRGPRLMSPRAISRIRTRRNALGPCGAAVLQASRRRQAACRRPSRASCTRFHPLVMMVRARWWLEFLGSNPSCLRSRRVPLPSGCRVQVTVHGGAAGDRASCQLTQSRSGAVASSTSQTTSPEKPAAGMGTALMVNRVPTVGSNP